MQEAPKTQVEEFGDDGSSSMDEDEIDDILGFEQYTSDDESLEASAGDDYEAVTPPISSRTRNSGTTSNGPTTGNPTKEEPKSPRLPPLRAPQHSLSSTHTPIHQYKNEPGSVKKTKPTSKHVIQKRRTCHHCKTARHPSMMCLTPNGRDQPCGLRYCSSCLTKK